MTKETRGRKRVEIDIKVLDALMQFKLTKRFVADYFDCSEDTIDNRIKEYSGMTFSDYGKLKQEGVAVKLQQKCIELALKGDRTLMIFALKNMAMWSDKIEQRVDSTNIQINIDDEDAQA